MTNSSRFSRTLAILAFLGLAFGACRDAGQARPPSSSEAKDAAEADARDLARTIDVSLQVGDVDRADRLIRGLVGRTGGFVQRGTLVRGDDPLGEIDALVPAGRLADFRAAIARVGKVDVFTEQVEDVTAQRLDLDVRLENSRVREARLRGLLSTATGNLADVLAVEQELSRVREEIERMQAERAALGQRIEYVVAHLRFRPIQVAFFERPGQAISEAAVEGGRTAWGMLVGLVVVGARLGPSLVVLAGLFGLFLLGLRAIIIRRRRATLGSA